MSEGFNNLKKKLKINAILSTILSGLGSGVLITSLLLLIFKLSALDFNPLFILIGVAASLITASIIFVCLYPFDLRLAKYIDKRLGGKEEAQTMLACKDKSGDMVELQRASTNSRILAIPKKETRILSMWISAGVMVLATIMLIIALVVPKAAVPEPPKEPEKEFEFTDEKLTALQNLIDSVKESKLQDDVKSNVVLELEALLDKLYIEEGEKPVTEKEMKTLVVDTILSCRALIDKVDYCDDIGVLLIKSNHDFLTELGTALIDYDSALLRDAIENVKKNTNASNVDDTLDKIYTELPSALKEANAPNDYTVYIAFNTFLNEVNRIIEGRKNGYSVGAALEFFNKALPPLFDSLTSRLPIEKSNEEQKEYITKRLMEIFGITEKDVFGDDKNQTTNPEAPKPDDDNKQNEGGMGSGNTIFGSNELVYYPKLDIITEYGTVIDGSTTVIGEYYARVIEAIMNGNYSPEVADYLRDYFNHLYNTSENEGEE